MNKLIKGLIIGIILGLIIGLIAGYFLNNKFAGNFQSNRNLQISETSKQEVASFFNSTVDVDKINQYCQTNRINCNYYCRVINPTNEFCSEQMNFARGARPQ
ncbi:MAG: hypothetical protein NT076_05325 [Candidatus Pacearchaeota archaeon]|nr:hypothetical protein [Candidatus Pacearchaeota archaeon]